MSNTTESHEALLATEFKKDKQFANLLLQINNAFFDEKGNCHCIDINNSYLPKQIDRFKNSLLVFDGKFYGIEPELIQATADEVNNVLNTLRQESLQKTTAVKDSENRDALVQLLETAIQKNASDIHLRLVSGSQNNQQRTEINGRIDGLFLELMPDQPLEFGIRICSYFIDVVAKAKMPFSINGFADEVIELPLRRRKSNSTETVLVTSKWRLSQIPIDDGSKITLRNQDTTGSAKLDINKLGLNKGQVKGVVSCVNSAQGALLLSGPTGSGKTTLINAALLTVPPTRYFHSLEDPVEFSRGGRNQFASTVNADETDAHGHKVRSFAALGKRMLRHDPDGQYFGEVRDTEGAETFVRLASTGQVMVGTIHCNSAIAAIPTLVEQMKIPVAQLAAPSVLRGLAHVRLVRQLCPSCRIPHSEAPTHFKEDPTLEAAYEEVNKLAKNKHLTPDSVYYRNVFGPCQKCGGRGEMNRTSVFEIVLIDDAALGYIRNLDMTGWLTHLKNIGWPSIREHAESKLFAGMIDIRSMNEVVDNYTDADNIKETYATMKGI